MKKELWHWRYRSPTTGRMCRTLLPISVEEAAYYPEPERVDGTRLVLEVDEPSFDDTTPGAYPAGPR